MARAPASLLRQAADHLRQHHVLLRRELGQQMVELVDEADLDAADAGALGIGQPGRRLAADIDLARVLVLQQAGDVQQRRLAGAGRRDEGDRLPLPDHEIGAAQDVERVLALRVAALDALQPEHGVHGGTGSSYS